MRVTQSSLTRNYIKNLNRNISNLAQSNQRMTSERKFSRVSENTADAARAFNVREQLYKNEQYLVNIRDAEGELASAESNLKSMSSLLQTVEERLLEAMNGTKGPEDREIYAREIESIRDQLLQFANAKYGNKYLFGGTNNATPCMQFDATGKLLFNGVEVDTMITDANGKPLTAGGDAVPQSKDVYLDMGLGLKVTGGNFDTKSAVKVSTSALEMLGFGSSTVDGVELPNNLISLLDKVVSDLRNNDVGALGTKLTQVQERSKEFVVALTDLGTRSNFLSQTTERLENDILNLKTTQKNLEAVDIEEEAIYNKSYETAWMITLQLGSKVLPVSIFDFMR